MAASPPGILGVLRITAFRKLWIALSLSSLGDWLGLLAQSALAASLVGHGYARQSYAVAGVFVLRLVPAVLFGPVAGVVADRLDRRWTMVTADSIRCSLFISIPLFPHLWWLYVATFCIEVAAMFWIPAKEATVPNLVPRDQLEAANQVSLLTAYGTAPIAAGVFTMLALLTNVLAKQWSFFTAKPISLALYFDALTFLFSALTIWHLTGIPARSAAERAAEARDAPDKTSPLRALFDGWSFIGHTPKILGIVIGTTGAFAAGGVVIGLANLYVHDLGGGQAGYGVLFGTVFLGMAGGMFLGPHVLAGIPWERLFGAVIAGAGVFLCVFSVVPNLVVSTFCALIIGFLGGTAWIIGQTMLGRDVADELRGRTFAFVQSLIRVTLVGILALAPAIAGTIGRVAVRLPGDKAVTYSGSAITLFGAGLLAMGVGWVAYRMMDDVPGKSLRSELRGALRRNPSGRPSPGSSGPPASPPAPAPQPEPNHVAGLVPAPAAGGAPGSSAAPATAQTPYPGFFLSFEGGDGSGKSTQLAAIAAWLVGKGHEVVTTREPGGTLLGGKLREIVLDARHAGAISPRAEALIYAADRADHVARVVRPGLARGAIVMTDRYIDSSLAYQGAGRALSASEVGAVSLWATEGLKPDATVLLDLAPEEAARRRTGPADRLELESLTFHGRVRERYLELAATEPQRFLVVDAGQPIAEITRRIESFLEPRLPASPDELREQARQREREEAETARQEAERVARLSAEERAQEAAAAEHQEKQRAEEAARLAKRRAHRERLESDADRVHREAIARAREAAAADLARNIAKADRSSASPTQIAARAQAAVQAQEATAETAAQEISAAPPSGPWEVPDYVEEPQLDGKEEQLTLTDELLAGRRPREER